MISIDFIIIKKKPIHIRDPVVHSQAAGARGIIMMYKFCFMATDIVNQHLLIYFILLSLCHLKHTIGVCGFNNYIIILLLLIS